MFNEKKRNFFGRIADAIFNKPEIDDETIDVTYTYDGNGALTKLVAIVYDEDGAQYSVHEYSFVNSRLFYSTNPNVKARADVITYQDVWVALEIMY